ncbi:MAG: GatB/YqeY domain-containing protein [Patescibacteria group bacterium]|jgi:hypothetical protein
MSVYTTIQTDMVVALKGKDDARVLALRGIKAAMQKSAIDNQSSTDDDQRALLVLKQEAKKIADSITTYQGAGRVDLANKEQAELEIIKHYLPTQLDAAQVKEKLQALVVKSPDKNFSVVMKQAMSELGQQADGKVVSAVLKELLAKS